jgi:hypothetical protein
MSDKQRAVVVGAVVVGVLSTSYLQIINILCCLGVLIGGAVAAQQMSRIGGVETGDGALLGAGAGALGAVFAQVFDLVLRPFELDSQSISRGFMESMTQTMRQSGEPVPPALEQMMQQQSDPSVTTILFGLAFSIVLFAVFGAIGGAIGAAIFGSDDGQTAHPGAVQQPPEA